MQRQPARRCIETREMKKDVSFHRGEKRKARQPSGFIQEICPGDFSVLALLNRILYDKVYHIHLSDYILKSSHVRVRDLGAGRNVAKSMEMLQQMIRELVLGGLNDDALKIFWFNVPISVLVENVKGLAYSLSLEAPEHLGELRVCHVVTVLFTASVKRSPFAIPVERYALRPLVHVVKSLKVVVFDRPRSILVEESERDFILSIWFAQEVFEIIPVMDGDFARLSSVCYTV